MTPQESIGASMAQVSAVVREAAARALAPDPSMTVSEWADKNRVLTSRSSPEPGPWRTSRTPYLKEVMNALSPSNRAEMVVLMSGSQVGKTECGNNWLGYSIDMAPGPMMAVQPSVEMAKRNSKQRIAPLIEDCPALRAKVRDSRSRDSGNTVLAKEFPGGILVMTGANSAKGLRSTPVRYLFLDEVDGFKEDVEEEGEPCDLAIARTTNFARRKIFITSTPVLQGRSRIEKFFQSGTQEHFYVPCPHCEFMQELKPDNFVYAKGNPESAHFVCEACDGVIVNHQKNWMLPRGQWRAHNPGAKVRSFYLPSYYSPVGWLSWAKIAEKHEASEEDSTKRQVFWNTILGLPWADQGEVPDDARLYERREEYPIGMLPEGALVLTAGADVQARRIEIEVVAHGRNDETWSIDYRVFEGDTNQPDIYKQVARLMDADFPTFYGAPARISKLAIDTGYNTLAVYDFVRDMSAQRVMGVKGQQHSASFLGVPTIVEVGPMGRRVKHGARVWPINVSIAKEQLYRRLRLAVPDYSRGEKWPAGFCHFPQYSKEYFEQLCGEQLVTRIERGYRRFAWEKRRDRNEALDCRVYAMAAAASLRLETWPAEKWDETQNLLTRIRAVEPPSATKAEVVRQPVPQFKAFPMKTDFTED